MRTTVVVITWRGREHLRDCLDALTVQQRAHRVLVVDNASDDGIAELLAGYPFDVVRLASNTGYAGGLAAALGKVDTPLMAWLNDDAAPEPGWLSALEDALDATPTAAAAASDLLTSCGDTQSLGVALTADGHGVDVTRTNAVFGFCGGAALLRTATLRAVGGVPASFFCYYEDTDTSWRLRLAGHQIVTVPGARVRHLHGASTRPGSADFHGWNERNRLLMLLRCAPLPVAAHEFARFVAITAMLPLRVAARRAPAGGNFAITLRCGVLLRVLLMAPAALRYRRRAITALPRRTLWRDWAGGADDHDVSRPAR